MTYSQRKGVPSVYYTSEIVAENARYITQALTSVTQLGSLEDEVSFTEKEQTERLGVVTLTVKGQQYDIFIPDHENGFGIRSRDRVSNELEKDLPTNVSLEGAIDGIIRIFKEHYPHGAGAVLIKQLMKRDIPHLFPPDPMNEPCLD